MESTFSDALFIAVCTLGCVAVLLSIAIKIRFRQTTEGSSQTQTS